MIGCMMKKMFMKCLSPLYAIDYGVLNPETLKKKIKILSRVQSLPGARIHLEERFGAGSVLELPCGKCINCKINYSRTWAIRCMCEALYHEDNFFVTLTFNEENYVTGYEKLRREAQLFFKRLRKVFPGVRYFGCCEKGDHLRNHFHFILFGLPLADLKCLGKGPKGGYYYESKLLQKIWSKGFITIGDVNYTTCNYVAQYCLKKVYRSDNDEEFVMMSTKPGIGTQYFKDHWQDIYDTDKVYLSNGDTLLEHIPPRYFDKLLDRIHPLLLDVVKRERLNKAQAFRFDKLIKFNCATDEDLLKLDVQVAIDKMKDRIRKRR